MHLTVILKGPNTEQRLTCFQCCNTHREESSQVGGLAMHRPGKPELSADFRRLRVSLKASVGVTAMNS